MTIEERKIKQPEKKPEQRLILDNRKTLSLGGVLDVASFSDSVVVADTVLGRLTVKGEGLRISKLNIEAGDLSVEGIINALEYSKKKEKTGFFESIFK